MRSIAVTGSIGMGKSTTAKMFREAGVPVHDADEAVHRLYGAEAVAPVEAAFPGVTAEGRIDRARLGARVLGDAGALRELERVVHPLVRADADRFVAAHRANGAPLVVLDIPLLFETNARARVDKVAVVTASAETQRRRVLARPGMTREKFEAILARQMPDAEKRRLADFVIDTDEGMAAARAQVARIVGDIAEESRGQSGMPE